LDIDPSALANGLPCWAHPGGAPGQQAGRVDRGAHVREHEGHRLVLPHGPAELYPGPRVLGRVLRRCAGHADGHRRHAGPRRLEGLHGGLLASSAAFAGSLSL